MDAPEDRSKALNEHMSSGLPQEQTSLLRPARPLRARTGCEQSQQNPRLFDHLVGAAEQRRRNFNPDRVGGGQVDNELKLARLHDGQVVWLGTF